MSKEVSIGVDDDYHYILCNGIQMSARIRIIADEKGAEIIISTSQSLAMQVADKLGLDMRRPETITVEGRLSAISEQINLLTGRLLNVKTSPPPPMNPGNSDLPDHPFTADSDKERTK